MNKLPVVIAIPTAIAVCVVLLLSFFMGSERVAVLDYKKIISESVAVKKAGEYFSELQETYKKEIDTVKDQKEQVALLEKKQAEFAQKIEILDGYLNTTLEEIIAQYRKKNKIAIIFPKESALSLDENLDITTAIVEEFNKVPLTKEKIQSIIDTSTQNEQNSIEEQQPVAAEQASE